MQNPSSLGNRLLIKPWNREQVTIAPSTITTSQRSDWHDEIYSVIQFLDGKAARYDGDDDCGSPVLWRSPASWIVTGAW